MPVFVLPIYNRKHAERLHREITALGITLKTTGTATDKIIIDPEVRFSFPYDMKWGNGVSVVDTGLQRICWFVVDPAEEGTVVLKLAQVKELLK